RREFDAVGFAVLAIRHGLNHFLALCFNLGCGAENQTGFGIKIGFLLLVFQNIGVLSVEVFHSGNFYAGFLGKCQFRERQGIVAVSSYFIGVHFFSLALLHVVA